MAKAPIYQYGYGSYGISVDPTFSAELGEPSRPQAS